MGACIAQGRRIDDRRYSLTALTLALAKGRMNYVSFRYDGVDARPFGNIKHRIDCAATIACGPLAVSAQQWQMTLLV